MASILIIEDGTGVVDANSYATAAEARIYAAMRGVTLPPASSDVSFYAGLAQFADAILPNTLNSPTITADNEIVAEIDPIEILLLLGAQYLDTLSYIGLLATKGVIQSLTQGLVWPRVLSYRYQNYPWLPGSQYSQCGPFDSSYFVLPAKVKAAQCQLVLEQYMNGVVLQPTSKGGADGQFVIKEKVDVIETTYSEKLGTLDTPTMRVVDALLAGLTIPGGGFGAIRTVRV